MFNFKSFHRDASGTCVKLGGLLKLRNPAIEDIVAQDQLPRLVEHLKLDILTEIFKRDFGAHAVTNVPRLVGPLLKLDRMGDATFGSNSLVLDDAGLLVRR
jgi:hypothetical protein